MACQRLTKALWVCVACQPVYFRMCSTRHIRRGLTYMFSRRVVSTVWMLHRCIAGSIVYCSPSTCHIVVLDYSRDSVMVYASGSESLIGRWCACRTPTHLHPCLAAAGQSHAVAGQRHTVSTSDSGVTDFLDAPLCFRRGRACAALSRGHPLRTQLQDEALEPPGRPLCAPEFYKSNALQPCNRNPHSPLHLTAHLQP